jgi:hypothetical protein
MIARICATTLMLGIEGADFDFDLTEPQDMEDQKKANSIWLCRET